MPKSRKFNLLDIAKANLLTAKTMRQHTSGDDKIIDICAYHCQQCIEKTAKYAILLQGVDYAADHRMDIYLEDLAEGEFKNLFRSIAYDVDLWATNIRHRGSILSSAKAVDAIIKTCDELIKKAEALTPAAFDEDTTEVPKPSALLNGEGLYH